MVGFSLLHLEGWLSPTKPVNNCSFQLILEAPACSRHPLLHSKAQQRLCLRASPAFPSTDPLPTCSKKTKQKNQPKTPALLGAFPIPPPARAQPSANVSALRGTTEHKIKQIPPRIRQAHTRHWHASGMSHLLPALPIPSSFPDGQTSTTGSKPSTRGLDHGVPLPRCKLMLALEILPALGLFPLW